MTFLEFLNRQNDRPVTSLVIPPKMGTIQVVKDFSHDPLRPKMPKAKALAVPVIFGTQNISDRPIAKKPTDFLARKGSSFRKSI